MNTLENMLIELAEKWDVHVKTMLLAAAKELHKRSAERDNMAAVINELEGELADANSERDALRASWARLDWLREDKARQLATVTAERDHFRDATKKVGAERDALREWFEFLADTKASFANGFFDGQLRWWLEWGGHLPVLQKDTYATPEDAIKAAVDAAKGGSHG